MVKVVGVSFRENGKIYHFSPDNQSFEIGTKVIVETERGIQIGIVQTEEYEIKEESLKEPLSKIKKKANNFFSTPLEI